MNENHYAPLRKIVLASIVLVPLISFVFILSIGYYYFKRSIETSTISSVRRIAQDHQHMIDSFLRERKANLAFILYSYRYEDLIDIQKLRKCFGLLQKQSNTFVDLGVFNEKGLHVAYQGPYRLEGRDYSKEAWFTQVNKQGHYISDVYLGYRRIPHFVVALRREDAGQSVHGDV